MQGPYVLDLFLRTLAAAMLYEFGGTINRLVRGLGHVDGKVSGAGIPG
jgi:hypothetical protein